MTLGHSLALAALLFSPILQAQQTWPDQSFTQTPAQLQATAATTPTAKDADVTILFEQEHFTLTPDGRATHRHSLVYRVESKAGVEDWSHTSVQWDPWYQAQPVIKARVLQADGRVTELDPKTLTDVPAKNEQDDTFSDARIHKGPLPSVAIGSIVEEETTVADSKPFFAGGSVYRVYFSRNVPVLRSRLIVEVPSDAPFQALSHFVPDSALQATTTGSIKRSTYELAPVPLFVDADIELSTDQPTHPFVEFSTGASWAGVSTAYQQLAEPQVKQDQARAILPSGTSADYLAGIQAIVSRLHKEVRYTGIEFGESAIKPETPSEILKRHYGDCKDKAALLVAMLRASGVPATLALLETGPGYDVNPALPGMNQFDHAIVHVPATGAGKPELWIDATAEFTRVGDLPYMDTGRMALIIADGTSALTKTPEAKPTDSVLVETRDFTLAPFGKAHVVESSATTGQVDSDYRYRYGSTISKQVHEEIEKYAINNYYAKRLVALDHGNGADMGVPFSLKLDIADAARGTTTLTDAAVGIRPANLLNSLPGWFFNEPQAQDAKVTADQAEDHRKAEQARAASYLVRPFISEWRYRIHAPEGFLPRGLPEDQTVQLGPATLTRHYAVEGGGTAPTLVTASYRFDTVKQRYTTEEVLATRKAVLELDKQGFLLVQFDQAGARLATEGKVREALAADRATIAAHPSDAMAHVQLSTVLLGAGLGDQAQAQARLATTLDPKSAIAFYQLGAALEYNAIGVHLAHGFDRKGALDAYRHAVALEPDNTTYLTQLAVMEEHNDQGERYPKDADLAGAIRDYRKLPAIDKETAQNMADNLLYALLYNGQFAEVIAELGPLAPSPTHDAMAIAATSASTSVAAGLKRADLVAGSTPKSAALRLAGIQLMRLGLYADSAALLEASQQGQGDAASVSQQVELFKTLKHMPVVAIPATDPRAPVSVMLDAMVQGNIGEKVPVFLDRHAYSSDAEWLKNQEENARADQTMQVIAQREGLPAAVMNDLVLSRAKITAEGDDAHGYHATMETLGSGAQTLFVARDAGAYKVVADGSDEAPVGNYAMYLVAQHREGEAKSLLDWKRELVHRGGGDDPMSGPLFPRFWTVGDGPEGIETASLALSLSRPATKIPFSSTLAAYAKNPASADIQLLLAESYLNLQDAASAKPYLEKLLAQYPDSLTVLVQAGRADQITHDYNAWKARLDTRLARRPSDADLLRLASEQAAAASDFAAARVPLKRIIDSGKATSNDYNSISWLALFDGKVDAKAMEDAQQSNTMSHNANWGELHTLACLYAMEGKTTEARQLLLKVMSLQNAAEPNPAVWLGFGLIDEQFGEKEAAVAAYRKVTAPDLLPMHPTDNYVLAQMRLKALGAL